MQDFEEACRQIVKECVQTIGLQSKWRKDSSQNAPCTHVYRREPASSSPFSAGNSDQKIPCGLQIICRLAPGRRCSKKRSLNPGYRAQVAELVDAVRRQNGLIVQVLFPDTYSAQLVTDSSYLGFSTDHNDDAPLAGDTIKGCMKNKFCFQIRRALLKFH